MIETLQVWGAMTTFYTPRRYMDSLRRSKLTDTGVWPGASAGSPQVCLQDLKQEGALFTNSWEACAWFPLAGERATVGRRHVTWQKSRKSTTEQPLRRGSWECKAVSVEGSECEPPSSRAGDEGLGTCKCSGEKRGVRK